MKEQTERARYWEAVIQEQAISGMPIRAFCEQRELTPCSFYWWRRELQGLNKPRRRGRSKKKVGSPSTAFVEVVASPQPAICGTSGVTLRLDDRVNIVVDPGFDHDTLSAVLAVVRESSQCWR